MFNAKSKNLNHVCLVSIDNTSAMKARFVLKDTTYMIWGSFCDEVTPRAETFE